jgi:hypothetical protein
MTDINEFLQSAVSNLGVDESAARSGTGAMLRLFQKNASGADFSELLNRIPGAQSLLGEAPREEAPKPGGGSLSSLLGQAAAGMGGSAGSALGLVEMLRKAGIGAEKTGPLAMMFVQFIQTKAGQDLAGRLLGSSPELKRLLG